MNSTQEVSSYTVKKTVFTGTKGEIIEKLFGDMEYSDLEIEIHGDDVTVTLVQTKQVEPGAA